MSTDPAAAPTPEDAPAPQAAAPGPGTAPQGPESGAEGAPSGEDAAVPAPGAEEQAESGTSGADGQAARSDASRDGQDGTEASGGAGQDEGGAPVLSEAEAELAAQRELRRRIEERKAGREAPVTAGGKLQGVAADLLAAVKAVEGGAAPTAYVPETAPAAPRRPAPEPVRPSPAPAAPTAPAGPSDRAVDEIAAVLADGGAPAALAPAVAEALGDGAAELLREDPWQLLHARAVRPEQADGFARALLGAEARPDDARRGRAVTGWLLEQAALAGHTALEADALRAALAQRAVPDPEGTLRDAVAEGDVLVFQDPLDSAAPAAPAAPAAESGADDAEEQAETPVRVLIGLERYALAEESLADGLAGLVNTAPAAGPGPEAWQSAGGEGRGSAAELIRAAAGHGLVLHSGGEAARSEPAALLTAAASLGLRAWGAAHGPDSRARLAAALSGAEGGGAGSATVAGLLSGAEGPGRDAEGSLALDLLVVLDAPQLDVESAAVLIEALPDGARLVLSGDPGVLGSAGPGRVFGDLLAARACPVVVSRTPDPGPVGELVSGVGAGELVAVDAPGHEVAIVPVRDPAEAVHRTVQLVTESVPRAFQVPPGETLVVTPGHGGAAGTRVLNAALKEKCNPGPGRFAGFDPGDRVAYSPAPGRTELGQVAGAEQEGLRLRCAGGEVLVARDRVAGTLRHGWAVTAHQAVALRAPAAVVVVPGDAGASLARDWVYTAFGRAERHLSVVQGVGPALASAVAERPAKPRTTRLPLLLRPQLPAPA
ncbi:helix-hairpin-helix domain-containing protein [Streptomyces sp. NPDC058373]|uniref:helix-hairpin-helix domain-containing protein n=1 Tax=Streptomyces sp. NPDC058373 TaxID=3346465 RepID=UPI00364AE113